MSKKVAPCQKKKHPNALWGEILEPFLKFEPDMLGFKAANMQQMYGTQFDVNNFNVFVDLCIHEAQGMQVKPAVRDLKWLGLNFGFVSEERIWQTLKNTTEFARAETRMPLRRHFKTRFLAANVSQWNEDVATDTFFSDVPAHDDGIPGHWGCQMVQLYSGIESLFTAIYPMYQKSEFPQTLQDFIRQHGAPNGLTSDNAKEELSKAAKTILCMYAIKDRQSEPEYQNQNPAEWRIQEVKKMNDAVMDRTGTPAKFWLLCMLYVVMLLNYLATQSLGWKTPLEKATGQKADISP